MTASNNPRPILKLRNTSARRQTPCILVEQDTNRPVPLPFHTTDFRGDPITVTDFIPPREHGGDGMNGYILTSDGDRFYPSVCDLRIITEAEYMEGQQP